MNPLICCISDSHIGYRHKLKTQRLRDYAKAFLEAMDKAMNLHPRSLVLCGDILHHAKPDSYSMRLVVQRLKKAADLTPIVVCIGNHEIEGNLNTTYTPIYSDIHPNIHVLTTETPHVVLKIGGKNVGFHGFQFIRDRRLAEETLIEVSNNLGINDLNVLCLHQGVEKYLSPFDISIKALREVALKYNLIILGHVHKFQPIEEVWDLVPAYYAGSTEHMSFNEAGNPNGVLVFQNFNFRQPRYILVDSVPMKKINIKEPLTGKPEELNAFISKVISENKDAKLLQISLNVNTVGDYLEIRHDWEQQHPEYTVLDVNVTQNPGEKAISLEKNTELSENLIREYFEKTGMKEQTELMELCIQLYNKYGK